MHVIVVGAGITGLTTARALLQAGWQVTVIEQAAAPAQGASAQNGAQLSYAYVAPMASWATLKSVPGLLLDPRSALRLRPGWSAARWAWCLQFLLACNKAEAERSTRALLDLGSLSREHFEDWRSTVDAQSIDFQANGKLVLLRDAAAWRAAEAQLALQAPWGAEQQLWGAAECLSQEPALAADDRAGPLMGGVFTPSESVADCARVCQRLAQDLAPHCKLLWQTEALAWQMSGDHVESLRVRMAAGAGLVQSLQADAFVVANGVAAPRLLAPLGLRLPITALKGYSIDVPAAQLRRMPRFSITDSARKIVFAPLGKDMAQRLRVAGMAELVGDDLHIPEARIQQLKQATDALFGLRDEPADLKPWAGQRPATPTGRPFIGRLRQARNVYVNAGQGALGFTLAFGSAALLLAHLQGRPHALINGRAFAAGLA